mgnify:CR=1 FL=1
MTTIKVENSLLDISSSQFKAAADEIESNVMAYWYAERADEPPFFVQLEVFMTLDDYNKDAVFLDCG